MSVNKGCELFQNELPDLVLTPNAAPSMTARAHLAACQPCAREYLSFQRTFEVLNTYQAPAVSPYFAQRLSVLIREEQKAPPMSWFESITTRLTLNTGRSFRPAMAGALALAMVLSGGGFAGINAFRAARQAPSATVTELQILDHNEEAFQTMDMLQQEEQSAPATQNTTPGKEPIS